MNTRMGIITPQLYKLKLTDKEFNRLSTFIRENYGIKILPVKRTMLQGRLYRRLQALKMGSFSEYLDYLFNIENHSREVIYLMNEVSTNKTDFFREPVHFDFLKDNVLSVLDQAYYKYHPFNVWSAGCSSGEEVFTLAMVLEEFRENNPWFNYRILGTDISTKMLDLAENAIYKADKILPVPHNYRKKYLLKSKDKKANLVRIVPELRHRVRFQRLNFMDEHYRIGESFDLIFCRNVLIYFDHETREKIIRKLCTKMKNNSLMFLGHSESITRMNVPLKHIKPTIFTKI